jgi:catechol 2,3-dioxygenase-like lactoylglutathione lyase family enzyme
MTVRHAGITLVTPAVERCRDFHCTHFGARVHFDCGWYVVLRFGDGADAPELAFMTPRDGLAPTVGALVNFTVDDVDALHARCLAAGLAVVSPLEDHDWGDRSFGVVDPSGALITLLVPIPPRGTFVDAYAGAPEATSAADEISATRGA